MEISGLQEDWGTVTSDATFTPSASADDAYVSGVVEINTAGTMLYMGSALLLDISAGIRFRSVTIPAGATIVSAIVRFTAAENDSDAGVNLRLLGENNSAPAVFSTVGDFWARARTSADKQWNNLGPWIAGTAYDSPDISSVIQEIVDRDDWASGNNLSMFVESNESTFLSLRAAASFDHPAYTEPQLIVDYVGIPNDFGREATCFNEVYIANKRNDMQLSNIYHWDNDTTTWSDNLVVEATPYNLLPDIPAVDDIVLFGIDSALIGTNTGVFASLVFDLVAQTGITGADWRYSDAASASADPLAPWASLAEQDNTNEVGAMTGVAFDTDGVGSVHWNQPDNWTTRNPQVGANPALGVTAYWIALVVTADDGGATAPQQQNRNVYTITWPEINIDELQVPGDIQPLARVRLQNRSDAIAAPTLEIDRCLMALRSESRGADFTPFINIDDQVARSQNPDNFTIVLGGKTASAADVGAPIGRSSTYTATLGPDALSAQITIQISNPMAQQYIGRFHAYARVDQTVGTVNDVGVQLRVAQGNTSIYESDTQYPTSVNGWQLLDFGSFDVFSSLFNGNDAVYGALSFALYIEAVDIGDAIKVYDFILMPIDELFTNILNPMDDGDGSVEFDGATMQSYILDVDSVTFPKKDRALNRASENSIVTPYRFIAPGHLVLQANADQRMFFLQTRRAGADDWRSEPSMSHSVRVERVSRYFSGRGDR